MKKTLRDYQKEISLKGIENEYLKRKQLFTINLN